MGDSWMLRPDYAELAKTFNATGASISTAFLLTRIWARTTQNNGLWWDDYLLIAAWALQLVGNGLSAAAPTYGYNVYSAATAARGWAFVYGSLSAWSVATAFVKSAFTATLLRLSGGRVRIVLWLVVAVVWACSLAVAATSWLDICEARVAASIKSSCVSRAAYLWIHIANSMSTVCIDFLLAYLPWHIVSTIHLPKREKWAVSLSMSLTGVSGVVCLTRIIQLTKLVELEKQGLDFTYGAFACHGLLTFELVLYIIAQTIPMLRVLLVGHKVPSTSSRQRSSDGAMTKRLVLAAPARLVTKPARAGTTDADAAMDMLAGDHASIELVQLPSGRVVAADSDEGRAHRAALDAARWEAESRAGEQEEAKLGGPDDALEEAAGAVDDEVHRLWADMGLSHRASTGAPSSPSGGRSRTGSRTGPSRLAWRARSDMGWTA